MKTNTNSRCESDIVKHAVKYQVGSIDGDVCDIGQKPLSIHTLLLTLTEMCIRDSLRPVCLYW